MKNNKEVLSSILKTTQMGQVGIRAVLNHAVHTDLRNALQSQLREYDAIEAEVQGIAAAKGLHLEELEPPIKAMSMLCARAKLAYGNVDSKIAAMMIQGNTRGMIKGLKNRHHAKDPDARIMALSQKLLDCEDANIRQMQGYV